MLWTSLGKHSKILAPEVASGKGDWEARSWMGGRRPFYCIFFLCIVNLEHQKSRIWYVGAWNSRETATNASPKSWWWVNTPGVGCGEFMSQSYRAGFSMLDMGNYGAFIPSLFCKAHFYELVQPAVEHDIHHIDRKFQGLELRFLHFFHLQTPQWHKNPQRCTPLSTLARHTPSQEVQVGVIRHGPSSQKDRVCDSPVPPISFRSLICNMGTISHTG